MAITSTDIQFRLSGGSSNSDPVASLGGVKSSTAAVNYFDDVTSAEAGSGDVEYRCIYVHNNHGSLTLLGAKVFIQTQTPSSDTDVAIGLGTSAINGTEQTVANEDAAPSGVSFSAPASFAAGLSIGDLAAGAHKAVWVRRTVNAGATAYSDSFTLRVQGDTNP